MDGAFVVVDGAFVDGAFVDGAFEYGTFTTVSTQQTPTQLGSTHEKLTSRRSLKLAGHVYAEQR